MLLAGPPQPAATLGSSGLRSISQPDTSLRTKSPTASHSAGRPTSRLSPASAEPPSRATCARTTSPAYPPAQRACPSTPSPLEPACPDLLRAHHSRCSPPPAAVHIPSDTPTAHP